MASRFSDRYRVVALDRRGHGESDWHPDAQYGLSHYVSDFTALVEHMGFEEFDLVGHSMGAHIAMAYTAYNPERVKRLVMDDEGARRPPQPGVLSRFADEYSRRPLSFPNREAAEHFLPPDQPYVPGERPLTYGLKELPDGTITWRADVRGLIRARGTIDPMQVDGRWPLVDALSRPTLLIRGGRSDILAAEVVEEMARRNPQIRPMEMPDAGHYVHHDAADEFISAVGNFLQTPA